MKKITYLSQPLTQKKSLNLELGLLFYMSFINTQ